MATGIEIGKCRCPSCSSTAASLRLGAKQLPYCICNRCNFQAFARSDVSDAGMRTWLVAEAAPAAAPAPAATVAAPPPPPKPAPSWGMFR